MHPNDELVRMSHDSTEKLKRLLRTGITDMDSLLAAVKKDLPKDVILIDASTETEVCLLVRNLGTMTPQ